MDIFSIKEKIFQKEYSVSSSISLSANAIFHHEWQIEKMNKTCDTILEYIEKREIDSVTLANQTKPGVNINLLSSGYQT